MTAPLLPTPQREDFRPTDAEFLGEFLRRMVQSLLFASSLLVGTVPFQAPFPASDPMDAYGPAAQIWLPLVHAISITSIMSLFAGLDDGSRLRLLLAGCCATIAAIIGDIASSWSFPAFRPSMLSKAFNLVDGRAAVADRYEIGVLAWSAAFVLTNTIVFGIRRFVPALPAEPASNDEPRSS